MASSEQETHEASTSLAVAVAQFAPGADTQQNLATILELATTAVQRGARLVVFPEYSSYFVDPVDARFLEHAEPLDGPFTSALSQLADALEITIVAGMAERTDAADRFSNTLVAVGPGAGILATYRKQHLYDAFGARESDAVLAGELVPPQLFDVDDVTVGLQTCYDLRFPELTRTIVDEGADLVVVPSEWVRGPLKEYHWRTLITARAIENTVFVAASDHVGPIGVGSSIVVDPMGVVLADAGERPGVALAWLSLDRVHEVRRINPTLSLRRYDVVPKA
ncbi:carbon-nitrogen hydrolase family protein [Humibacter ginsenosidimutans]|uniref:Carbon-nitrogen hydrolase family protein n=1 Tax=Humibacter ginsenosidimutans TaxID=2599293 RepID=A0A5B8M2Z0_9MICO|nr:carbon-nitrogen hydrolase family protein [Humibacter ginsenosidimutans]QDZ14314.1 carbon-nitrogen hydrolase family protein [Humibacter ginsenosidimutans]